MNIFSPLGIPQMMLILALMGFALMKQGWLRVITSLCLIIWGAFAIKYDIKIAAPLLAIGTTLFFMGILNEIRKSRESQEEV
jgi:energy-converting hydrogenase Eha subunit C